ncbi:MAG TPA: endo-1,4-beta-xylanase [Verrucomicrobiae bacterium]|nr:endo-1,4-beta-xylanase [Verrucomicrobiae bacterium]
MKQYITFGLIACGLFTCQAFAQTNDSVNLTAAPVAALKDAYAGKFLIGCAGDLRGFSAAELENIKTHYNVITPENSMKPQPTHPSEDEYNFTTPDALVKWAGENGLKVWGHTLVWHAQTGRWFFEGGTNGQPVTRELALERLKKHIMTVAGRYKGRVIGWDVVNESIADRNAGETENLRNSSWYRVVGPDVLTFAFKWAHEADPGAQLYYNDYNIEQGAVSNTGKHASSLLLLKRLKAEGAPIHGVGIQGHWHLNTNLEDVDQAIENYASLGLRVAITELDVTAFGENSGAFPSGEQAATMSAAALQKQADVYARLFQIFKKHEKSIDRVTFWGISDRRSWRARQRPLLFDAQLQPKPAFEAVVNVGLGKATTPKSQ